MTAPRTYCDYNAGAPIRPEAAAAVARALEAAGNPSSVHSFGRAAKALIEDARERVAASVEARPENVVFTSGATEALHLAIEAAGAASLIVSAVEHDAAFACARQRGGEIAPVDQVGVIDLGALEILLARAAKPALVILQLANSETGVIQPIARVAALCRAQGALLLVDAAQALGRVRVSLADLDATYLVLSSHKIAGPPGAGALVLAPGAPFVSTRFGGGQERGRRPGTENAPAIAGFGVAAEIAAREQPLEAARMATLRDRFEAGLPFGAVVLGAEAERLPNTSNFALPGMRSETAVIALDLEGVGVSAGSACSSGKVRASRVLEAMGVASELATCALRVSFGWRSTASDVEVALGGLAKIAARRALKGAA